MRASRRQKPTLVWAASCPGTMAGTTTHRLPNRRLRATDLGRRRLPGEQPAGHVDDGAGDAGSPV